MINCLFYEVNLGDIDIIKKIYTPYTIECLLTDKLNDNIPNGHMILICLNLVLKL